jgi:hypothetical protein
MVNASDDAFAGWAIVEVVGRKQYAGKVREQLVAGHPLLRVDVPEVVVVGGETIPAFTKFVGPGSIYMLTPTDEATARRVAAGLRERPVHLWQSPMQPLTALTRATDDDASDDYNPDSDEDIPDDLDEVRVVQADEIEFEFGPGDDGSEIPLRAIVANTFGLEVVGCALTEFRAQRVRLALRKLGWSVGLVPVWRSVGCGFEASELVDVVKISTSPCCCGGDEPDPSCERCEGSGFIVQE